MDNIIELIKIIVPIAGTLLGTLLGVLLTQRFHKADFDRRAKKEYKDNKIKVYVKILYQDGESNIIFNGGHSFQFNIDVYMEKIRPVIYDGFQYLDEYPAKMIREIDARIQECGFREEVTKEDNYLFTNKYFEFINSIKTEVNKYSDLSD